MYEIEIDEFIDKIESLSRQIIDMAKLNSYTFDDLYNEVIKILIEIEDFKKKRDFERQSY